MKQKQIQQQTFYPRKESKGYIHILVNGKWELEHRFIMSEYLGRPLLDSEKVHHDDFNKLNNDISNLTLFPSNKAHNHWHRQFLQFGITQPRLTEIKVLKELMNLERLKNKPMELIL